MAGFFGTCFHHWPVAIYLKKNKKLIIRIEHLLCVCCFRYVSFSLSIHIDWGSIQLDSALETKHAGSIKNTIWIRQKKEITSEYQLSVPDGYQTLENKHTKPVELINGTLQPPDALFFQVQAPSKWILVKCVKKSVKVSHWNSGRKIGGTKSDKRWHKSI